MTDHEIEQTSCNYWLPRILLWMGHHPTDVHSLAAHDICPARPSYGDRQKDKQDGADICVFQHPLLGSLQSSATAAATS